MIVLFIFWKNWWPFGNQITAIPEEVYLHKLPLDSRSSPSSVFPGIWWWRPSPHGKGCRFLLMWGDQELHATLSSSLQFTIFWPIKLETPDLMGAENLWRTHRCFHEISMWLCPGFFQKITTFTENVLGAMDETPRPLRNHQIPLKGYVCICVLQK